MAIIDFKVFTRIAPHVMAVRKPVLIRGRHGVGKSEIVEQMAKELGLPLIMRRASQMTEGDLIGLPFRDGETTKWLPPDWFKAACTSACVLFFDEVDRAVDEVAQQLFELNDNRSLYGNDLHPDTIVVAAINGGAHGAKYQVRKMDPAELDRWTVFDVEPSVEDWLDWAADDKVHSLIWDFINNNRTHLEHSTTQEPDKVYPSRRSWTRLSETLVHTEWLKDEDAIKGNLGNIAILTDSFCGIEAAGAFRDFAENYRMAVSMEDLLDDGKFDLVADWRIDQHAAMVDKIDAEKVFDKNLTKKRAKNLAGYIERLPSELAVRLWQLVLMSGNEKNIKAIHKLPVETVEGFEGQYLNKLVVSYIIGQQDAEKADDEG
jgi:hypothetical protein